LHKTLSQYLLLVIIDILTHRIAATDGSSAPLQTHKHKRMHHLKIVWVL
jgi:hypothetical protein